MKYKIVYIVGMLLVFLTSSCSSDNPGGWEDDKEEVENKPTNERGTPFKEFTLSASERSINEKADALNCSIFSDLIAANRENVFYSPMGLHTLLSMLVNGASEEAAQEILKVLDYDNIDEVNDYYKRLIPALIEADDQVKYSSLNSAWFDMALDPSESFTQRIKGVYGAEFFKEDLDTEDARLKINGWASEKTDGMITNFLDQPLDENTMMVLLNALYFNGKWTRPFDKSNTDKGIFHGLASNSNVDMMHTEQYAGYYENEKGVGVSLRYGNGTYHFNAFLPNEGEDINRLADIVGVLKSNGGERKCNITVPKFALSYENKNLRKILEDKGIIRVFNDFNSLSGIATPLKVDQVKQKTAFRIDESGAAAAAVTGNTMVTIGDTPKYPTVPEITLDRPFIFTITAYNDIVLFAGIVRDI